MAPMGVIKRINPSGSTCWGIQYFDEDGRRRREFNAAWRKRDAETAYGKITARRVAGIVTRSDMIVEDVFAEWHANYVAIHCSPSYLVDTESQYRLRIRPHLGQARVEEVNRRVVRQWIAKLKQEAVAKYPGQMYGGHRSINKSLAMLKGILSYAVEIEQIAFNPAHGIKALPEEPTRPIDSWPMEAVTAVAMATAQVDEHLPDFQLGQRAAWAHQRDFTIVLLAALTGLRQSELLGLTWGCIDGDWLHVTHKLCRRSFTLRETKSRRGRRRVPLLPATQQLLASWHDVGAHRRIVFPNHLGNDYMRASAWDKKVFARARRKVGIVEVNGRGSDCTKMTFHQLRHTFASLCLAAGRDVWEVANWLGDDPDMVKQVYGHYLPDSLGDTSRLQVALTFAPLLLER